MSESADPIITEIVRNGLVAITEEMKSNLLRTAYSMIIYEAQDFTVGLFDRHGGIISIGIGLPTFIRGMSHTVRSMLEHFGEKGIVPGDVLVTNDAYTTGSHLYHFTFTQPMPTSAIAASSRTTMLARKIQRHFALWISGFITRR